jgi:hypothetical protein
MRERKEESRIIIENFESAHIFIQNLKRSDQLLDYASQRLKCSDQLLDCALQIQLYGYQILN